MVEGSIHLKLTIVETAGFGDQLDKDKRLMWISFNFYFLYKSYIQINPLSSKIRKYEKQIRNKFRKNMGILQDMGN